MRSSFICYAALVFGMPGAVKSYLAGRQFSATDEDGISHGTDGSMTRVPRIGFVVPSCVNAERTKATY